MKVIFFLIVGFIAIWAGMNLMSKGGSMTTKDEVKAKINSGAMIVDVRSPGEYAEGHYKGAINIPVDQVEQRIADFGSKDKDIVVYCRSGGRSSRAKQILEAAGYKKITNGGGLSDMP